MPKQLDRSGAVSWVKRVVGTDVPSLLLFTASNRRLAAVLKVARDVEGTAEAGLRRLLGALGYTDEEAPPEGVAQWVLAWLAVASTPSATADEFADLLRSSPKATPPPQTPGHMPLPATVSPADDSTTAAVFGPSPPAARRVSFAESDDPLSPHGNDLRDCNSAGGSRDDHANGPVASGRPESLPGEYRRDTSLPAVCSELGEPACKSPTGWCAGRTSCVPSLEERAKRFADLVAGPPPPEFCDVRPPSRLSQPASDPGRDPAPRSASNVGECPPALEARLERHEASDRSRIADSECAAWIALVGDIVSRARAAPFSFSRGAARRLPTFVTPAAFAENPPSCPDNLPVFNNARPVYNPRPQFVTPASFRDSPDLPPASLPPSQPPSPRQWVRVQAENGIEGVQWVKR
ncbi:hypothetical protein DIPPA_34447 [Diplonema papillatum]|nr:hypothetical protein DIPPA_34447 [Diplonema papillatum]